MAKKAAKSKASKSFDVAQGRFVSDFGFRIMVGQAPPYIFLSVVTYFPDKKGSVASLGMILFSYLCHTRP